MLVHKNGELASQLKQLVGSFLIRVQIRMFGMDEFDLQVYNNIQLSDFLKQLVSLSGADERSVKIRAVDQTFIRRIDNKKMFNKETNMPSVLSDFKIKDGTAIMVEIKEDHEIDNEEEAEADGDKNAGADGEEPGAEPKEAPVNVDDTPNIFFQAEDGIRDFCV